MKGFTLIEMLMVVAVLGIISTVGIVIVSKQVSKGYDGKLKNDISELRSALFSYYEDTSCFPNFLPTCGTRFESLSGKIYMAKVPCDSNGASYIYESNGGACSGWFRLYGKVSNTSDKDIDRVGCRNGCGPYCGYNYGLSSTNVKINEQCTSLTPTSAPTVTPGGGPTPTPTAGPSPTPGTGGGSQIFACTPSSSGQCIEFIDPSASKCPKIYVNDPTCNSECNIAANRCKNEKGKKH